MRRLALPVRTRIARLIRQERGAAAVEFALILPFLLTLFLGSIEASSLITVDRRVTIISSSLGDLVARTEGTLTNSQLTDFFQASQGIIFPYPTTSLKQVVSLVQVASNGTTSVTWSCGYNGGTKRTALSAYALPTKVNELARTNGWVVVSETSYSYLPVLGKVFQSPMSLASQSYYLPRYETAIGAPTGC